MKLVKLVSLKTLKKSTDKLWADIVKLRDKRCAVCGSVNRLNAHHILGKNTVGIRFDLDNGIALCSGHHIFFAHKFAERFKREYVIPKIGQEKYEELYAKSKQTSKVGRDFYEAKIKELQEVKV